MVEGGVSPLNNFDDSFKKIRNRAGIDNGISMIFGVHA
jgi:hypothetical protein